MELNRTVKALQFYFKGILHLSLEIQTDPTPKVISVVSSNLGIFWIYCSVLILQSLWFFEHLKILCCKQFVYQKSVMVHYHQTCIFHSPQASHQAAKHISTSLGFVSPSLLMLQDYRSVCNPFFFQSKVLVWTCIGLNSKTRRFWQLAETTLHFDKLTIIHDSYAFETGRSSISFVCSIHWQHNMAAQTTASLCVLVYRYAQAWDQTR
jgi:hypothetical protein